VDDVRTTWVVFFTLVFVIPVVIYTAHKHGREIISWLDGE
jgi:hypothetical protein